MNLKKYKDVFIGISILLIYYVITINAALPFQLLKINTSELPRFLVLTYTVCIQIIIIITIILLVKDKFMANLKDFKKNNLEYFKKYLKYWLYACIVMVFSNFIISLLNNGAIAGNEEGVRDILANNPIYLFISAVFIAPVLEELVFRQGIRNIFKNDYLFIAVAGLVFGAMHVIGNVNSWVDYLYLIPYSAPGVAFAYMLVKSKNIFVPMSFHFIHNGILISLQILLMLFM